MINSDILRRLRYTFNYGDTKMIEIFGLGGAEVTRADVSDWLKKEEDPLHRPINDRLLASFLNGLIIHNRGRKEGEQPVAEKQLGNNAVLRKLKIALNFRDEDILEIMELAKFRISKHELSAFFRKEGHVHYRECKDQVLRNFLYGLADKYAPKQD
jgi:uncharacterized protein YehS (DUF1456 family)